MLPYKETASHQSRAHLSLFLPQTPGTERSWCGSKGSILPPNPGTKALRQFWLPLPNPGLSLGTERTPGKIFQPCRLLGGCSVPRLPHGQRACVESLLFHFLLNTSSPGTERGMGAARTVPVLPNSSRLRDSFQTLFLPPKTSPAAGAGAKSSSLEERPAPVSGKALGLPKKC